MMAPIALMEGLVNRMFADMVQLLGQHTVRVLLERALWETASRHQEARLIRIGNDGVSLHNLAEAAQADTATPVLEDFILSTFRILTRLIGEDLARRVAGDIEAALGKE